MWEGKDLTLEQMVVRAQTFQDEQCLLSQENHEGRGQSLKMVKKQLKELLQQLQTLKASRSNCHPAQMCRKWRKRNFSKVSSTVPVQESEITRNSRRALAVLDKGAMLTT